MSHLHFRKQQFSRGPEELAGVQTACERLFDRPSGRFQRGGIQLIAGTATATVGQLRAYIKAQNPNVPKSVLDMASLYLSEGAAEGIRRDVAFAQSCLETGNFGFAGSAVTLDQNNFCGMGVTANGMKGNSFDNSNLGSGRKFNT